jgi:hypothetical protein
LLQLASGGEISLALLAAQFGNRLDLLALHHFAARRVGAPSVTDAFGKGRSTGLANPQNQQGASQQQGDRPLSSSGQQGVQHVHGCQWGGMKWGGT